MEKAIHSPLHGVFRAKLVGLRKAAGFNQRQLAKKLRREHSFVARIEQGERRVDFIEFIWICRACGANPEKAAVEVIREIAALEKSRHRSR